MDSVWRESSGVHMDYGGDSKDLLKTQRSGSNVSLVFSQFDITTVPLLVYVILALTNLYLLAQSAKLIDTNLMGRRHKLIFSIFLLSLGCVPWFQTLRMPKKCSTGQNTNTTPPRSLIFLMVLITIHSWRLL